MAATINRSKLDALLGSGLKVLLLVTFVSAYLNAILRVSPESTVTAYRVMLPLVVPVVVFTLMGYTVTWKFVAISGAVIAYSLLQMFYFGLLGAPEVWSYLINLVATIFFIYFVYVYKMLYGEKSLFAHLYLWYAFLVVASVHQLITGYVYPNAAYQEGVARIFFGQENDTSLALAGFIPLALTRVRRDPLMLVLLLVGIYVIYENNTRGVLIAMGMFPLFMLISWVVGRFGRRIRPIRPLLFSGMFVGVALCILFFRDVPLEFADHTSSLTELLLEPVAAMATGQLLDAELTSINLRVTLAVVGIQKYLSTLGFGLGPGASTFFVVEYFPDIATSMHIFALQLLVESGWLFVGLICWMAKVWGPKMGWPQFLPMFAYFLLVSMSITSGALTNYFFFACATYALTALRAGVHSKNQTQQSRHSSMSASG